MQRKGRGVSNSRRAPRFEIRWREVSATVGNFLFDELERRHAYLSLGAKRVADEQIASQRGKESLALASEGGTPWRYSSGSSSFSRRQSVVMLMPSRLAAAARLPPHSAMTS